ncbi:MAG: UPF0182 family protein [Halanaerobiales bacterium]|nr:UPF0182 family protein [Halanaerobiales bacterium]
MKGKFKYLFTTLVALFIIFIILIFAGSNFYTDWAWFNQLGYLKAFLLMFFTNFGLRILIGLIFAVFVYINLTFTKKLFDKYFDNKDIEQDNVESLFKEQSQGFLNWISKKKLNWLYLILSIVLGFMFSSVSSELWKIVLKYFNQTPFGTTDPIFNKDIAFFVFSLPFYSFIKEMAMVLVILTIIVVGIIYFIVSGVSSFSEMKIKLPGRAKSHITVLLTLFLLLKAWDYRISMYELLYSSRGVAFGASYTDVNANLLGLRILFYIAIIVAAGLLLSLFKRNYKILAWGLGIWLVTSLIFGGIYPGFVQRFRVEPNEIARESEYINYNIEMTLKAYGLDNVNKTKFEVKDNLTRKNLDDNKNIINNIKLWDSRPLLSTYSQLQELRQYYDFQNIDDDRYTINGEYRQVMISGRELNQDLLSGQAQTWINKKLKYTHGFGVAMSPVNRINSEGLPEFFIKDIPPNISINLLLENSSIYYGEKTDDYVIVKNDSQEFHYPQGDQNVYVDYEGNGGVEISGIIKKAIFAVKFNNVKIMLNSDINNKSRIMYNRNIKERVRKVAPFLAYDSDPYIVISDGRLFWIQDAYTTTNRYPYSEPIRGVGNYIKNSIKVVIDAYNGTMNYYVIDDNDPLAQTYKKIFPEIFNDGDQMPEDIRKHIRYPKDLFRLQANLYSTYHMTDSLVFYNKEDLWNIPNENYSGNTIKMDPYYITSSLPDKEGLEFLLMMPFTPATKNNMIAWMAARSDGDNYGDLVLYEFPKDTLVYGPSQIESRIDQDSEISQKLTLWSQRGSSVIRGNLLVIPIERSLLYIEPIYLQAESGHLPELKRVIVGYGGSIVMSETLDGALNILFGEGITVDEEVLGENVDPGQKSKVDQLKEALPEDLKGLVTKAYETYQQAVQSLKEGKWQDYGDKLESLEEILQELDSISKEMTE